MNDIVVTQDGNPDDCGAVVFWRLSGRTPVSIDELLKEAGADGTPWIGGAERCLRAAVKRLSPSDEYDFVRALGAGRKKGDFGFFVQADVDEGKAEVTQVGRVYITKDEELRFEGLGEGIQAQIHALWEEEQTTYSTKSFSSFLAGEMDALNAARIRESGGVYFLPPAEARQFRVLVNVVHQHTEHFISQIPALQTEDVVRTILEGLERELKKATGELMRKLPELGKRALKTQETLLDGLIGKVVRYEEFLDQKLDAMAEGVQKAKAAVAGALLAAEEDGTGTSW